MVTNQEVIDAWIDGYREKTKNMSTDGHNLYSYQTRIGCTISMPADLKAVKWRGKLVFNYTSSGKFISQTTSRHVLQAKRAEVKRWKNLKF